VPLLKELKRRNVVRAAVAYLAGAWLLLQVANTVLPALELPDWIIPALIYTAALGFPLALILAWLYEWTPEGLKATAEADAAPVASRTSRRKFDLAIFGAMALAIVFLVVDNYVLTEGEDGPSVTPRFTQLTFDGGLKDFARLSPNGELVAYAWNGPNRDNWNIYVRGIGRGAEPIQVTDQPGAELGPAWSPDGRQLAYVAAQGDRVTISVVPFPRGEPRKLTEVQLPILVDNTLLTLPSWSPDRRFLVYGEKPAANSPARIMRLDVESLIKEELTARTRGPMLGDFAPSYSPDGRTIAFIRAPAVHANRDVWTMNADGSGEQRVTANQWSLANSVAWLPDTGEIAFTAGDAFVQRTYSVRPDQGTAYPLTGLGANDRFVSGVGDRLVFTKYADTRLEIFQVPGRLAANRDANVSDSTLDGSALVFSPRGDRLAWQSRGMGIPQIWTSDRSMTNPRAITDMKTGARFPQWSPDGVHIVFETYENANAGVYVINIETGQTRPMTTDAANAMQPAYSHDGRWIYFASDRSGAIELLKMPSDGGTAQPAVDGMPLVAEPGQSIGWPIDPDGRFLYFEQDDGVWRVPVDGSAEPEHILAERFPMYHPWVPTKDGIYYQLQTGAGTYINYLDFMSRNVTRVFDEGGIGLSVSPDEKTLFFSRSRTAESELWLVEDFR
jgi:Tol biopolymer transport system component